MVIELDFFERIDLPPIDRRLKAIREAGWNTFQLKADDVFLDMLIDSGVNAMSINQLAAMMSAQDAYAGSRLSMNLLKLLKKFLVLNMLYLYIKVELLNIFLQKSLLEKVVLSL